MCISDGWMNIHAFNKHGLTIHIMTGPCLLHPGTSLRVTNMSIES